MHINHGRRLLLAALALVVIGAVAEQVGRWRDRHRYPQIGRSVDIGGRSLNLSCAGDGSPTVVFDTFSHEAGYRWIAVQRQIATFTRACWYDRAGYGWSDAGPLYPTSKETAQDLHALLSMARIPPPYVLVGNGDVALQARVYTGLYPAEVAGMVLLNPNDLDEGPPLPMYARSLAEQYIGSLAGYLMRPVCAGVPMADFVGLVRASSLVLPPRRTPSLGLTPTEQHELDLLSDSPVPYLYTATSLCMRAQSKEETRAAGTLGDRPLVVLWSQQRLPTPPHPTPADRALAEAVNAWTDRMTTRLASLSTRGRVVNLEKRATADDVVVAIRDVVRPPQPERVGQLR